ncbi:MAG: hypothetical protein ACFCUM_05225 [Bacteroidales bacterium]
MVVWLILISLVNQLTEDIDGDYKIIYSGAAPAETLYTDQLENAYFVDGHKLIKISVSTGERIEYGSLSAGRISSADVSNPFQLLIFYRDFNQVVFLNNKLSTIQPPVNLSEVDIEQAALVCSSGRGGFWVYNDLGNRLVYFDRQLRNTNQSMVITSITGSGQIPVFMSEVHSHVYLNISGYGILVFDRFASLIKTIPYSGPDRFQVIGGKIVYFLNGELYSLDTETHEIMKHDLPPGIKADNAQLQSKGIFILSDGTLNYFRTK